MRKAAKKSEVFFVEKRCSSPLGWCILDRSILVIESEQEETMPVKYVFVTGGVVSGLGKGITAASLGRLAESPWL